MQKYKLLTNLRYPDGETGEEKEGKEGEIVDDIPSVSIDWLLKDGHIELAEE